MNIILGSQSPRRKELLALLDVPFVCRSLDTPETYPDTLHEAEIPRHLVRTKAEAFGQLPPDTLLITADTIVWLDGHVFGKPTDKEDAKRILARLSGRTHQVITGVCLTTATEQRIFSTCTQVTFATIDPTDINYYVDKYAPLDKAGAYGVQEWIGAVAVEKIEGSYFNVMGLPVHRLRRELKDMGAIEA